jgi:hypothetical protein
MVIAMLEEALCARASETAFTSSLRARASNLQCSLDLKTSLIGLRSGYYCERQRSLQARPPGSRAHLRQEALIIMRSPSLTCSIAAISAVDVPLLFGRFSEVQDSELQCLDHCLSTVRDPQLGDDVLDVVFRRTKANNKIRSDLTVSES